MAAPTFQALASCGTLEPTAARGQPPSAPSRRPVFAGRQREYGRAFPQNSMKKLALLLLLAVAPSFALSVTAVSTTGLSHGSVILLFTTDTSFNSSRVRIYASGGSCTGSGGLSVRKGTAFSSFYNQNELEISGLAAATSYVLCPEVSSDGGTTWNTSLSASITTLAFRPSIPRFPSRRRRLIIRIHRPASPPSAPARPPSPAPGPR